MLDALPLAHHALVLAVPFVVPVLVTAAVVVAAVIRDRLRRTRGAAGSAAAPQRIARVVRTRAPH